MINKKNIIEIDAEDINQTIDFGILKDKTIMITGASGLLGTYFLTCIKVASEKIKNITVVAIYRTELPSYMTENFIPNLKTFKGDISDIEFCKSLPNADFIIHAAGYGQPLKFMENPDVTIKLNTLSTFLLFDKLNKGGNFLFISSSEVYSGNTSGMPLLTEEEIGKTNTTHPRACYIEGKRTGETICNAYRYKGIKAASVRLSHTYGPGTKKGDKRVLLAFIEKALNGKIELLDNGEVLRTYCYIADAIEIMWKVLFSCKDPIYNLSGNSDTTIKGMAEMIGQIMNVPVIVPQSEQGVAGAPENIGLSMAKVKAEFGKEKYIGLKEGLEKTIHWYIDNR